jgi:hypothetical protein
VRHRNQVGDRGRALEVVEQDPGRLVDEGQALAGAEVEVDLKVGAGGGGDQGAGEHGRAGPVEVARVSGGWARRTAARSSASDSMMVSMKVMPLGTG